MALSYPDSLKNLYLKANTGKFPKNIQFGQLIIFRGNLYKISKNLNENIKFNFPGTILRDGEFRVTYLVQNIIDTTNINLDINFLLQINSLDFNLE